MKNGITRHSKGNEEFAGFDSDNAAEEGELQDPTSEDGILAGDNNTAANLMPHPESKCSSTSRYVTAATSALFFLNALYTTITPVLEYCSDNNSTATSNSTTDQMPRPGKQTDILHELICAFANSGLSDVNVRFIQVASVSVVAILLILTCALWGRTAALAEGYKKGREDALASNPNALLDDSNVAGSQLNSSDADQPRSRGSSVSL
jgi:hypothetical protein